MLYRIFIFSLLGTLTLVGLSYAHSAETGFSTSTSVSIKSIPKVAYADSGAKNDDNISVRSVKGDIDNDGDLDIYMVNDGDLDIYVANGNHEKGNLWINDGSGAFSESTLHDGNNYSNQVSMGDFDSDGYFDLYIVMI